jgi:hypothetical protein
MDEMNCVGCMNRELCELVCECVGNEKLTEKELEELSKRCKVDIPKSMINE